MGTTKVPTFVGQLEDLINAYSKENGSDTPDWVLAEYLEACLKAFDDATNARTNYFTKVEKAGSLTDVHANTEHVEN